MRVKGGPASRNAIVKLSLLTLGETQGSAKILLLLGIISRSNIEANAISNYCCPGPSKQRAISDAN